MKRIVVFLALLIMTTSCARKVAVHPPAIVNEGRYSYLKDDNGRLYIVAATSKDFDEAMKKIHPGPASVNKLDLWVITPLTSGKKPQR